ncbi:MAG: response regulator transcription factor [Acidimicrobiia bacterium]
MLVAVPSPRTTLAKSTVVVPMARILIADDARTVRVILSRHLQAAGHDVVEAADGVAAYELGIQGDIDLAVVDQLMPGMLGTEVITRWKEDGFEFPVLVLTAVDDDDTAVRSFEIGAADYVRKPFNMSELTARINGRLRDR